eukprot:5565959-Prymnesium_polylepis.1
MPIRVRSAKAFATKVIGLGGGAHIARAKLADVADWRPARGVLAPGAATAARGGVCMILRSRRVFDACYWPVLGLRGTLRHGCHWTYLMKGFPLVG